MRWVSSLSQEQPLLLLFTSSLICPPSAFGSCISVLLIFLRSGTRWDLFFFWKKLHRVQVTSPGSWLLQGPRGAVSRCTSWEIALSNLPGLYWLLFASFGFWLFLRAQTLTLCFNTLRGRVPCHALVFTSVTVSKTTLSSFLWVQFPVISCLLNVSCPTLYLRPNMWGTCYLFPSPPHTPHLTSFSPSPGFH